MASTFHNQHCYYGCLIGFEPLSEAISLLGRLRNVKTKITFNKKRPTQDWLHLKLSIRLKNLLCTFLRLLQKWVQHTSDNYQLEYYTLSRKLACNENFQQLKSNQRMKLNIAFKIART